MLLEEIEDLFHRAEGDRLERKASLKAADGIRDAICAFADDLAGHGRPGVIIVGQNDDLSCAGLDRLLSTLAGYASDGQIQPFPVMAVEARVVGGCPLAVIAVEPSSNTLLRRNGGVKVRVGPTTRDASPEEERRLVERRRWSTLPFDAQPVTGAGLADLDLARFAAEYLPAAVSPEALAENSRSAEDQLVSLRLARRGGIPTPTGLLAIGKAPLDWLPGACIQFIRFGGPVDTDPIIDQKQVSGTLLDQARQLDELVRLHVATPLAIGAGLRHGVSPDYPEAALRQVLRNALMHRTYEGTHAPVRLACYSDRIEVLSPGGPFGQVSVESFGRPGLVDYRNPTIAEAMRVLGLVERFGIGLQIVRGAMRENGNPEPEFIATPTHCLVVLRRRS